jgi:Rad3-related DNA helicase
MEAYHQFIEKGGIFIAAGFSEGIDLRDDLCRLTLIPCLDRPNLGDPSVQKRKALRDGETWYRQQVIKQTIQRTGRSTRHIKDKSITIIGDPGFARLIKEEYKNIPKDFLAAIRWGEPPRW